MGKHRTLGINWYVATLAYCCSPQSAPGQGNTTQNPAFSNAANDDYRLSPGSPCIDAGTNAVVATAEDLDGHPRIVFGTADMGAYEYVVSSNDYDGDGMSNDEESAADTDRTDPASRLAIIGITAGSGVELVWIGGTNARQFVEMRSDLGATGEQWTAVYTNEPVTPVTNAVAAARPGAGPGVLPDTRWRGVEEKLGSVQVSLRPPGRPVAPGRPGPRARQA